MGEILLILLIDDAPAVQLTLTRILEQQNYHVVVVNDVNEGILQAQILQPQLIICDWMISGISGLDVCLRLKANPNLSNTFFILLTGLDSVADCVQALEAGADDFITKPIEPNILKARVRSGLRLHQSNRDLQIQKQILEAEFTAAADYVRSLLPAPIERPITIDSRFIPSLLLGGDCFDYFWLDPDYLAIYLMDTAGHGLSATLPSISVLNMLRSRALDSVNYYQPSDVLKALNNTFQMSDKNSKYFTIWYGIYNCINRQLIYSSGGHPPAILLSASPASELVQLQTPGIPIGIFPDAHYSDAFYHILPNSTLYIFSDGAYEIRLANGTIWDIERFSELLIQCYRQQYDLSQIVQDLIQLNQKDNFDDDLSLLEIKFN